MFQNKITNKIAHKKENLCNFFFGLKKSGGIQYAVYLFIRFTILIAALKTRVQLETLPIAFCKNQSSCTYCSLLIKVLYHKCCIHITSHKQFGWIFLNLCSTLIRAKVLT